MEIAVADLHWAVRSNDVEIVKKALAGGNSIECTDALGRTPVHWAVVLGHEEALKALLLNTSRQLIDAKDKHGRTSLHYACAAGRADFASILIKRGASANAVDCKGRTPLHYAALNAKPDTVELLVGRGANRDVADCNGLKPWDLALKWGCSDGFEILRIDSFSNPIRHEMKISDDIGSNGVSETLKENSCEKKSSSLDELLREWKMAEGEARKRKTTRAIDGLREALKAWREAEAEAKLKKQRNFIHGSMHGEQDYRGQVLSCSYASTPSQGFRGRRSGVLSFSAYPNGDQFVRKKAGEAEGRENDAWGCTEWESPARIDEISAGTNGAERWEKVRERRFGARLSAQTWSEPWVSRRKQAPSSAIEAI